MRNERLQQVLLAGGMALAAGAIVAFGNPVTKVSNDADAQVAQFAQAARTIGSLVMGRPAGTAPVHLG
ncbi:hypothetical protein KY084_00835 [Stakelama sp. CBK3Z-3]|uniref:Uncharacterized protein n=1 Tax=Stakelama flava TaxID=2860338 RepID=A0ABS6XGS8_9SPHN|nr:hypothetical protein [Stakelama flava]MBW4329423.1 hypothetical protein [Stakelama flava]